MPFFLYHPSNKIAQKMKEVAEGDAFIYQSRPHMENILKHHMQLAGLDQNPQLYMHIGSLAGSVDKHVALDPENETHNQILKFCHSQNKTPWSFVKLDNGPRMKCVIGYCNSDPKTPFLMSSVDMAQKGLLDVSHVPTLGG